VEDDVSFLKELSDARGVSGHEDEVRTFIYGKIRDLADECSVDALGSLIAVRKARATSAQPVPMKVMAAAHMDEVGLMITEIGKNGMLKFLPIGGIDPRLLLAKKVLVGDKQVPGVIGVKPIHKLEPDEMEQVVKYEQMAIDIGATSESEAGRLTHVGDYATFDTAYEELGEIAKGKAFDDRAGCAVLMELLKEDYPFDLYAVFTVQEEVGLRGARVAAYAVDPDCAIALEGTIADDLPKKKDVSPTSQLGAGPVISLMDHSFIAHPGMLRHMLAVAEEKGIPHQFKQPGIGGTDAGAIHLTKEGVPSLAVAVPCRYIHAPVALLNLKDLDNTVALVRETLRTLTMEMIRPE
jgi:putative aminopeptidase FrvX